MDRVRPVGRARRHGDDDREAALVDVRLAAALPALRGVAVNGAIDELIAAARDVTRPLLRRVAVLAALHRELHKRSSPSREERS